MTQYPLVDHSPRIRVVLYNGHSGNNINPAQYDLSRNWPKDIYVCQMIDEEIFGLSFVMIPGFNSNKTDKMLLWLTCTIVCHCKEVWQIVDSKVSPFRVSVGILAFMILC